MTSSTYEQDYKFGKENESIVLPIITEYFSRDIKQSADKYSNFDFYDNIYKYELKSFRCNLNKFENVFIDDTKLEKNTKTIILFKYDDALTYIKYNEQDFKNYKKDYFQRKRTGINDRNKLVIIIPIKDLTIINQSIIELDF
jgi:hypothetical protein